MDPGSPVVASEQHFAIGRHRGLAARGVVGQDRHHVAADGALRPHASYPRERLSLGAATGDQSATRIGGPLGRIRPKRVRSSEYDLGPRHLSVAVSVLVEILPGCIIASMPREHGSLLRELRGHVGFAALAGVLILTTWQQCLCGSNAGNGRGSEAS